MNIIRLLTDTVHYLMIFSFWIGSYVLFIVLVQDTRLACNVVQNDSNGTVSYTGRNDKLPGISRIKQIAPIIIAFLIFFNIETANTAYIKKDMETSATLSLMTRVIDRVEMLDGYVPGETPVAFVGLPGNYIAENPYLKGMEQLTGLGCDSPISYSGVYHSYFERIMQVSVNVVSPDESVLEEAMIMPSFPAKDSISLIDGIVIVKW